MIVRQLDGKLVLMPFREKINIEISDVVSVNMSETSRWDNEPNSPQTRAITIRSVDSAGEDSAVVLILEARTSEALEVKQER